MSKRVISGIVIAVLAVVLGLIGGAPLGIMLGLCAFVGYYELTRALGVHDAGRERVNGLEITGLAACAVYYGALIVLSYVYGCYEQEDLLLLWGSYAPEGFIHLADALTIAAVVAVFMVNMILYVLTFPRYEAGQVIDSIFAFLYAPLLIACIYRAQFLPYGKFVYALIFFCAWICDTCAWAAGRAFGRHKMTPVLSPHKTVEGPSAGFWAVRFCAFSWHGWWMFSCRRCRCISMCRLLSSVSREPSLAWWEILRPLPSSAITALRITER